VPVRYPAAVYPKEGQRWSTPLINFFMIST
jgi:hypothetical protein